jgi:integrase
MHECRHVYASHAIGAGVNAKTLSTDMGHANIAITFDLYGHLMSGDEAQAVELLDAYYARHAGGTSEPTVAYPARLAA